MTFEAGWLADNHRGRAVERSGIFPLMLLVILVILVILVVLVVRYFTVSTIPLTEHFKLLIPE